MSNETTETKSIDLKFTCPNGTEETVQVTPEQLKAMLQLAANDNKEQLKQVSGESPVAAAQPCDMAMQMLQLQQLQLQQLQGAKLNEFQKCQLDPDRMKLWAIGLPIAGVIVGALISAFTHSVGSEN